jgi:prevent-host-death family protein
MDTSTVSEGRILLVEHEPALLKRFKVALEGAGFETTGALGGNEALRLLGEQPFDAVIVDLSTPEVDGLTLARRLRARNIGTSVILVCGHVVSNRLAIEAVEQGVVQCLAKPVDADSLLKSTHAAVQRFREFRGLLQNIWDANSSGTRVVPATEAKNEFGNVLELAIREGMVVISKHDTPKAVLVSLDKVAASLRAGEPNLDKLSKEFDQLLARMQTTSARSAMKAAFDATPRQLGKAAVAAARKRG